MGFIELAIVLILGLPVIALLGGLMLQALKIVCGEKQRAGGRNEAAMIQEIYDGMSRLEERVETLETLVLDASATASRPR
jgi:phage shock protein B